MNWDQLDLIIDASCEIVMRIRDRIDYECDGREKNDPDFTKFYERAERLRLTEMALSEFKNIADINLEDEVDRDHHQNGN